MINTCNQASVQFSHPSMPHGCARAVRHKWGTVNRHLHPFTHLQGVGSTRVTVSHASPNCPSTLATECLHIPSLHTRKVWPAPTTTSFCLPCLTHCPAAHLTQPAAAPSSGVTSEQRQQSKLFPVPPCTPHCMPAGLTLHLP